MPDGAVELVIAADTAEKRGTAATNSQDGLAQDTKGNRIAPASATTHSSARTDAARFFIRARHTSTAASSTVARNVTRMANDNMLLLLLGPVDHPGQFVKFLFREMKGSRTHKRRHGILLRAIEKRSQQPVNGRPPRRRPFHGRQINIA